MANPTWKHPGAFEGRVDPGNSSYSGGDPYHAYGTEYGIVPGTYDYSEASGYDYEYDYAGHVFCLGQNKDIPDWHRLYVGHTVTVEQEFDIAVAQDLLKFCWDVIQPVGMPLARTILSSGLVSFKTTELALNARGETTGLAGLHIHSPASPLTQNDVGGILRVTGATDAANNIDYPIEGVLSSQGASFTGSKVMSYKTAMLGRDNDAAVTVELLALRWVARSYVNPASAGWAETLAYTERVGHRHYRNYLAVHLSKFTGTLGLRFELQLEIAA